MAEIEAGIFCMLRSGPSSTFHPQNKVQGESTNVRLVEGGSYNGRILAWAIYRLGYSLEARIIHRNFYPAQYLERIEFVRSISNIKQQCLQQPF